MKKKSENNSGEMGIKVVHNGTEKRFSVNGFYLCHMAITFSKPYPHKTSSTIKGILFHIAAFHNLNF